MMQDRKKIYSEQLLQIHTDSKKRNPGKEIYATGYVIELKKDCYFAGFQEGKILCRSLEYARYFFNIHSAEQFVKEYLGYAGLRCNLCKVAWGLAVPAMEPGQREELKPYEKNGRVMNFPSYHDGVKYQKKCMPRTFQDGQLGILAKALSIKPLSRWIREDFGNIRGLSYETAVWLLVYQEQLKGMEKEITMEEQVFYLLKNLELIKECGSFWELKEKLIMRDISWGVLKEKLTFSEDFVKTNATRIGEFIFAGGAEVMATYLKQQPSKKEEIRRLVVAELLGKFEKLKYPAGDLSREIDFAVSKEVELEWEKDLTYICGDLTLQEETRLLPIMQIGEIPTYSCISYRTGSNSHCLLSCFDSNKKFLFIQKNGQVVFRAMLRLTKGSYADDMHRKKIQFADLSNLDETKDEEGEELVLFLERYYEKNLSCLNLIFPQSSEIFPSINLEN